MRGMPTGPYLRKKENGLLVEVHADNSVFNSYDLYGNPYRILVLHPNWRRMGSLIRKIAVILPIDNEGMEEGYYAERGSEI